MMGWHNIAIVLVVCLLGCVQAYDKDILDMYMHKMDGRASYWGKSQGGSCQMGPTLPPIAVSHKIRYFASVASKQFSGPRSCGLCLKVRGTGEGVGTDPVTGEFIVLVNDICPACEEGTLDIGDNGGGVWKVEMQAIQCPVEDSKIEYKMHGSDEWFIRLQIRNARIPVQAVYVVRNEKEEAMTMSSDGFWQLGNGKFTVPLYIKMIGVTDEPIYDIIEKIENGVVQPGMKGAQFSLDPNLPK